MWKPKIDGFKGVDKYPCDGVDILSDITKTLPFDDETVDEILMDNVIEHILDIPALFMELGRICKKGAKISIITPHFASFDSWRDPTHVHHLSYFSMEHFEKLNVSHYTGRFSSRNSKTIFWRCDGEYRKTYIFNQSLEI